MDMKKISVSSGRNVENIRRKNVEDNQLFLRELLITNVRNDFLKSARSVLRKEGDSQINKKLIQQQKVEHVTRYNEKVKSGLIEPFVPEWQRQSEEKKKNKEKRLLEKELREKIRLERRKQRPPRSSIWDFYYKNNIDGNPYQRIFKPRCTKVGERINSDYQIFSKQVVE